MLSNKKFKNRVIELGWDIEEIGGEYIISKKDIIYATVGINEQRSTTFRNTPLTLKKLVRHYEDTRIDERTGFFEIPLKNLNLGGQQYITFNRVSEQFKAMDKLTFHSEDIIQVFSKEDIESDFFKEKIGDYLKYVEEA